MNKFNNYTKDVLKIKLERKQLSQKKYIYKVSNLETLKNKKIGFDYYILRLKKVTTEIKQINILLNN